MSCDIDISSDLFYASATHAAVGMLLLTWPSVNAFLCTWVPRQRPSHLAVEFSLLLT